MTDKSNSKSLKSYFKLLVLVCALSAINSNPLITVYTKNERYIKETLDDLINSVKSLRPEFLDLGKNQVSLKDQQYNFTTFNGEIFNFTAQAPIFIPFDLNGTIANLDVIFNNGDKENALQFDFICNYTIKQNTTELKGLASIRFISTLFKFRKGFCENCTAFGYSMTPELDVKFRFFDVNLLQSAGDRVLLDEFLDRYLKNNEIIKKMSDDVAAYIDKNVEKYFTDGVVEYYDVKLKSRPEPYYFSITPIMLPQAITEGNKGMQDYLDGKIYDKNGAPVPGLDYKKSQTPIFQRPFDYNLTSAKQIFFSYRVFADLIKVDLMKSSEFTVYENKVDLSTIPFRFNVMYLNKFLPGINEVFSNSQRFFVEIKIKDVVYKYGENIDTPNPKEESFVLVSSDIFFKTDGGQAGKILFDASLQTKVFLTVYRPVDTDKMNIKFSEKIEIVECIPKNFVGYNFDLDNFVEEFEQSYTITNIGASDYNLFEHAISLKQLIGENHDIIKTLKGVILAEMEPPTPPTPSINKSLDFLQ